MSFYVFRLNIFELTINLAPAAVQTFAVWMDKIGYNYIDMEESGYLFPVTEVRAKYIKSLRFGDFCRAKAVLAEYENMIKMNFELYNAKSGELTTKGSVSQMCVKADSGETQFVCPKCFTEKVEKLLKEGK